MKNLQKKLTKTLGAVTGLTLLLSNKVQADVVSEVSGGGNIQSSKLGQGMLNIVRDITGTMQWILPIVRSMFYIILCF